MAAACETASFEKSILASMASGVVGIDSEGRVVSLNAGAQRILGCPEGDLAPALGRDCREVLAGQPVVARLLLETLERKSAVSRAELELAGSGSSIGFTLCPVLDEQGEPRGAAMLFRDLAPIERGDEQERLRERLAALGQMAAGLAHEIRNPLAGMEVVAGLLRRRLADRPAECELIDEIVGELRALADTVSASLEFVRPAPPVTSGVDLVRLAEEALRLGLARVPFDGTVERSWPEDLPLVHADDDQLRTVLVNLVVNALEAMRDAGGTRLALSMDVRKPEQGGRSLRVDRQGAASGGPPSRREVVVSVVDNGPGVAPELREKIFYPFFTTKQQGSGVGLATAQKIAASHGGSLEFDPVPGGGCAFHLRLPVRDPR